jgi:8-amino-7-oxononanoate synthase
MVNFARPFIFATALNHCTITGIDAVCDVMESPRGDALIGTLHGRVIYAHEKIAELASRFPLSLIRLPSLPFRPNILRKSGTKDITAVVVESDITLFSPIIPICTPFALDLCDYLIEQGYFPKPIVYPVVPLEMERIRLCLHSFNTESEIDALVAALEAWLLSTKESRSGELSPAIATKDTAQKRGLVRGAWVKSANFKLFITGRLR